MTVKQIFNLALKMGIEADPRGKRGVEKWLDRQKKKYQKLPKEEKEFFDRERLTNPYADTRLLCGDPNKKVKTVLAGIDVEAAEIALARTLGKEIDLIITHHPAGKALAALDEVMHLQADLLASLGVPINVAEGVMKERIQEVRRKLSPANHLRAVQAAQLAGIPMMCLHTVCDNLVTQYVQRYLDRKKFDTLAEVIAALRRIPEYKTAAQHNAGPAIFAGAPENRPGKIVVSEMTGGTEGAKEIYEKLAQAGVGTVVGMHIRDENREEALKHHINVVVAGHISSDSLGMNLFLDKLAQKGIKIIPCSGLIRVRRK